MSNPSSPDDREQIDRERLIDAVRKHLLPLFQQQGFSVAPLVSRGPADPDLARTLPLGRLRRIHASGVDLVEIDFARDKNAFRVLAGVAPVGGVQTFTGRWPAEDVYVGWLDNYFEMYASPKWRRWFSVRRWPWQAPAQDDYENLAREVGGLVSEVDVALRDGQVGAHMRRVVMPPRVPVEGVSQ